MSKIDLNTGWELRNEELWWGPEKALEVQEKETGWLQADLPCDVHMPLIENGDIQEPLTADNCFAAEWTEDKSWWFRKGFDVSPELLKTDRVELTLESLDAEADVYLNGTHLGHHRSAHYPFSCEVRDRLKEGRNILLVRVTSGLEHFSKQEMAKVEKWVSTEASIGRGNRGDTRRVFVRKPQFAYGWDWGPRVATCGIMKGAWLEGFTGVALRSVHAFTKKVDGDVRVGFDIEIENLHVFQTAEGILCLDMELDGKQVLHMEEEVLLQSGFNYLNLEAEIRNAKLWWPNGMGDQPLYTVKASVRAGDCVHACKPFRMGIRTVRLNLDRLQGGERLFALEINGVRIFCKGGDWIPADSIYARITDEKYKRLVGEAQEAGFNMLRIWGGGLYERDIFYETCDQKGILLWHDFMFACALYPDDLDWFRQEVEHEGDYQTRRLRNHPSMALWCGNNENHWAFDEWYVGENKPPFTGGADCYNRILPRAVKENCPEIPYWNSSPYGGEHPNGNEVGDRHHWFDCMMNPDMEKRITPEEYDKVTAKFVSEYGYVGPCRRSSIERYLGSKSLDPHSALWQLHNNTFEKDTVAAGIAKHYTDPDGLDIDGYLLYAGLCQGLMYGYSLESMRAKPFCSGALFWMYNDCWGETGWTIIDYYLQRKISYYFVKRAFTPAKLILREENGSIRAVGINETDREICFKVRYGYESFDGKCNEDQETVLKLAPRSRDVVLEFESNDRDTSEGCYFVRPEAGESEVLPAILRNGDFRQKKLPPAQLSISDCRMTEDRWVFTVHSDVYAHAVHFNLGDGVVLSDEYFDLLPGESRQITVHNLSRDFLPENLTPVSVRLV